MRIGIAVDYGRYANASSLHLIAQQVFCELGKMMVKRRNFTVTALRYEAIGVGDVNQHFDCISVPNMGGYRFPRAGTLTSDNLFIGIVGIDEVVLGKQVYRNENEWKINKPIIDKEISKWKNQIDKIRIVHVSTNSDKQQLIEYLKVPEDKIVVIPLGVDHDIFKPASDKDKIKRKILSRFFMKDNPYFIHVSETNWARKNIFRLLEAYKKARKEGIVHNLIIVGKTEPIVYEKASSIPGVFVLGFVSKEDLVMLLQGADSLILPSLHEGFGLPIVEAMACGIPVVTSNVFSPPEVAGEGGLFVDPYDVEDITRKIIEISKNKTLQESLALNAFNKSKEYSWERTADNLLKLFERHKSLSDFDYNLDASAYRTLVTICETIPNFNFFVQDMLEFNYSRIIRWALEVGLHHQDYRDYLIPFKEWLISHSE